MNRKSLSILLSLALLAFAGCPADTEVVPAFVLINDFDLQSTAEGRPTENITEVWAFANNTFIGAFPLPARIPVPFVGSTELRFEAGVRQNGISSAPEIYEFYTPVVRNLDLVAGATVDLGTLQIGYRPDAQFAIFENFEAGFPRVFTELLEGMSPLTPSQDDVRSGAFSGRLLLTEDAPLAEIGTNRSFSDLTAQRPYVWLEVDYRSDAPVIWGVRGNLGIQPVQVFDPGFLPRGEWTKIYFNLSEIIVRSTLEEYQFALSALLPEGVAEGEVFLDNIKLIYF
ncbi:hypothetical protein QWY85_20050 [Neolewinella lacunae]|uniref:Uncharacterized protein n=1 Tax=Neolewinella lacunae TaxID=1517758 RepID=A0A923PP84_9BACT|nr:hypothetical protein [Neolewinella lacunae]MBC6996351.1 hypothetical protein [Neolewinella lacunae]MDN3636974.1 hypothetical protein [Neolewinella lacunae]